MKRRIAYKVVRAVADKTSQHRPGTVAHAMRVIRRDLRQGRFEAVILCAGLGLIELDEWVRTNIADPMSKAMAAIVAAIGQIADQYVKVTRAMVGAFANVKLPKIEAIRV